MTSNLFGRLIEYVQLKVEKFKLSAIVFTSKILANVLALSVLALVGFFFLFFLSFGLSIYLNDVFQSNFAGYFVVASVYLIFIIIIFILLKQEKIQGWLENLILTVVEQSNEPENTRKNETAGE